MGNNDINQSENILVKVDSNNLIFIDPNSVVNSENQVEPRGINPENLVVYVNLEADIVPRTILATPDSQTGQGRLISIAKGNLNFLRNQSGRDFDTNWTEVFNPTSSTDINVNNALSTLTGQFQNIKEQQKNDITAQSFGIESINISIKGISIPTVTINFVDVRGKTLFESPKDSPYRAFFHLPWPIFYLTIKGYYGKAIRYRLHLASFTSKFNEGNGNFDITTTFIGSTYAYLADIPLNGILNAPYLYAIEKESVERTNGKETTTTKKISKSSKGYSLLSNIYDELKSKNLIDKNFPVKTLREVITIAQTLDIILEREIFDQVANPKVFQGIRDVSKIIDDFEMAIKSWGSLYLDNQIIKVNGIDYQPLVKSEQNKLTKVVGVQVAQTLENILKSYQTQLKNNTLFVENYMNKTGVDFKKTTFNVISEVQPIDKYYILNDGTYVIAYNTILNTVKKIKNSFNSEKQKVENIVERKMNEIIKDPRKGFGFEPTIRNVFAVILANADVYIRLLKDVHNRAFEVGNKRKDVIKNLTDETPKQNAIYPWPEIKKPSADSTQKVLAYPGDPDLVSVLQSNDPTLWPEVDFIERYIEIATKKVDTLADKEQGVNKINYIFEDSSSDNNTRTISQFLDLKFGAPYTNKSIANVLYEIYERGVAVATLEDFDNITLKELANKEFENIQDSFQEDSDIIGTLKLVTPKSGFTSTGILQYYMRSVSPYERYPYFLDKLPTVSYISATYGKPFTINSYIGNINKIDKSSEYKDSSKNILQYKPKEYRKYIYPFNSNEFLHNINKTKYQFDSFDGNLKLDTKNGFISSPISNFSWVKIGSGYTQNLFSQKLKIGTSYVNILNTPYFHNQLFYDFNREYNNGKYAGSAYLLLNSLPFYDLHDTINFDDNLPSVLMSTLLKEVSATHNIPYHLILKWGSIYHRFKRYILDGHDILTGCTNSNITKPITGSTFFDNNTAQTFTVNGTQNITYSSNNNIGIHPFYDAIFHQVINGYSTYDITLGNSDFSGRTDEFVYLDTNINGITYWTGFFDNSIATSSRNFYTLLPSVGGNKIDNARVNNDFFKDEQNNFRILWYEDEEIKKNELFSGKTINSHTQYLKSYNDRDFAISNDYLKIIDLIGVFSPAILDKFEEYFLQFASERENVEIPIKTFPDIEDETKHVHSVKYQNFQELLKEIVTIKKESSDGIGPFTKIITIRDKQRKKLESITQEILSYDNLITLKLGNTKEVDYNLFEGFSQVNSDNTFSYDEYFSSQETTQNLNFIKLYLGEDLDSYYLNFFRVNNVEISEENILIFRPLIQIFAGWLKFETDKNPTYTPTKINFQKYIIDEILVKYENRIDTYITQLVNQFQNLKQKDGRQTVRITQGYNMSPVKLELYNFFKSYNDKWASGNSIGRKNLLEEFLFLDKANKDIGNIAYISLDNLIQLDDPNNYKIDLYSVCSKIIENSGFDLRPMPSYVNFYGTNFSSKTRISPSKKVARDIFGTFLEVDYEESSPKVILQYIGNNSKHPDMSDVSKDDYLYKDDSFNVGDLNKNPLIITLPTVYNAENLDKSNKVVAFEVSVGDQNQGIFKSIQVDQSSIKNTSESFPVLENIARSETGAAPYQIDTGLYDYYRQASYECTVTMMGNVMIQPTMYFYLKNIPMFRGTYWITEVSHSIRGNKITTTFKGSRVPYSSLPNPKDSFVTSYRVLFDKITNKAIALLKQQQNTTTTTGNVVATSGNTTTEKAFTTDQGTSVVDMGPKDKEIQGESLVLTSGISDFGVPYNGYNNEKYIQRVEWNGNTYFRAQAVTMGSNRYTINDDIEMSIINKITTKSITGGTTTNKIVWKDISSSKNHFYASKFDLNFVKGDKIITGKTTFVNPITKNNRNETVVIEPISDPTITPTNIKGPINVGPNINGYGIALSSQLMKDLKLTEGDVVYFQIE